MSIKYICPYCKNKFGEIDNNQVTEAQLGLHLLTSEERNNIISYEENGDVTAYIACEFCNEAIERHPELANPLQ